MILFRPFYGIVLVLWGVVAILGDGIEFKGKILLHYTSGELNNSTVSLQVLDSWYVRY